MLEVLPLKDRIVVRRISAEESTKGGLVIPDSAREIPQEAVVVAAGPGRITDFGFSIPMFVRVGDRVLVPRYAGADVTIDGQELLILNEDEVTAVVREGQSDPMEN